MAAIYKMAPAAATGASWSPCSDHLMPAASLLCRRVPREAAPQLTPSASSPLAPKEPTSAAEPAAPAGARGGKSPLITAAGILRQGIKDGEPTSPLTASAGTPLSGSKQAGAAAASPKRPAQKHGEGEGVSALSSFFNHQEPDCRLRR